MKKWFYNPFIYVAGWQALAFGWLLMLVTGIIAIFSKTHFDGLIDVHVGANQTLITALMEQLNDWLCAAIVFFIAGLVLSKSKIRFIDVAGTMALARAPMLFAAIAGFAPPLHQLTAFKLNPNLLVFSLVLLVFTIWMVVLIYNAFLVSCNVKGIKAIIGFIVSVLLAETASLFISFQFYQHLYPQK